VTYELARFINNISKGRTLDTRITIEIKDKAYLKYGNRILY